MKALSISNAETIAMALQDEIRKSPEARYNHRLHAILMIAQGVSVQEVASLLGDSPRTIQYWVNRFEDAGLSGLIDNERSGRPRRLNDDQISEIKQALKSSPIGFGLNSHHWDGKALSTFVMQQYNIDLGVRQCQRLLRQFGFYLNRRKRKLVENSGSNKVGSRE